MASYSNHIGNNNACNMGMNPSISSDPSWFLESQYPMGSPTSPVNQTEIRFSNQNSPPGSNAAAGGARTHSPDLSSMYPFIPQQGGTINAGSMNIGNIGWGGPGTGPADRATNATSGSCWQAAVPHHDQSLPASVIQSTGGTQSQFPKPHSASTHASYHASSASAGADGSLPPETQYRSMPTFAAPQSRFAISHPPTAAQYQTSGNNHMPGPGASSAHHDGQRRPSAGLYMNSVDISNHQTIGNSTVQQLVGSIRASVGAAKRDRRHNSGQGPSMAESSTPKEPIVAKRARTDKNLVAQLGSLNLDDDIRIMCLVRFHDLVRSFILYQLCRSSRIIQGEQG